MGYGSWSNDAYEHLSRSYVDKSADDIFKDKEDVEMSAIDINVRESRDSDEHPNSLAIMVFLDETGSMGIIPEIIVKEKLGALMSTLIDNGIEHPQILFSGIGDHISDRSPIQVGQFESETDKLDKWLTSLYLEGGGGGQNRESYLLAWLIAGRHTSIDCFEKRGEKGFLFTIGDEKSWDSVDSAHLKKLLGYSQADDVTDTQLLEEAQRLYNVYHIHVNETGYRNDSDVLGYWKKMLGERLIILEDYNAICETIATAVAVQHGVDMKTIVSKFDSKTASTVANALAMIPKNDLVAKNDEGILKL